jgi:hypothetical protein
MLWALTLVCRPTKTFFLLFVSEFEGEVCGRWRNAGQRISADGSVRD